MRALAPPETVTLYMFDKLSTVESQYEDLATRLGTAEVQSDPTEYRKSAKKLADLEPLVQKYREYKAVQKDIEGAEELVRGSDPEMRELARGRAQGARREARSAAWQSCRILLVPEGSERREERHPRNSRRHRRRRSGAVCGDLFRMYSRYAERQGWKLEVMSTSESATGGLKEVIASIEGRGVYSRLKYESGVHRVQRVPATEASGRIHTSTATVAVLPEAEEVDIQINEKDLRIDTFCSSGPGGQSVNTTYSAVRITHIPDRPRRLTAGREIADQEPSKGDEGAARASLRDGDAQTAGGDREGAAGPGGNRRTLGEDPDLQFSAEPHHRSSHQLHHPSPARRPRGRSRRDTGTGDLLLQRRKAQGSDRRSVDASETAGARRAARLVAAGISDAEASVDVDLYARTILGWDRARLLVDHQAPVAERARTHVLGHGSPGANAASRPRISSASGSSGGSTSSSHPQCSSRGLRPSLLSKRRWTFWRPEWTRHRPARGGYRHRQWLRRGCPGSRAAGAAESSRPMYPAPRSMSHAPTPSVTAWSDRIEFVRTSYLDGVQGAFDVITANPPYVKEGDKPALAPDVRHEPDVALFGGAEGLRDIGGVLRLRRRS